MTTRQNYVGKANHATPTELTAQNTPSAVETQAEKLTQVLSCNFVSLTDRHATEILRDHQTCLAAWLRAYINDADSYAEVDFFTGRESTLYEFGRIDDLLSKLITLSFHDYKDEVARAVSFQAVTNYVIDSELGAMHEPRSLIRDGFFCYLRSREDACDRLKTYDHTYAYMNLIEFIDRVTYALQDKEEEPAEPSEPDYFHDLTDTEKEILKDMATKVKDPSKLSIIADQFRSQSQR